MDEATAKFPREAGIARYGQPEEVAEWMAFPVSPGRAMDDRRLAVNGLW